MPETLRTSLSDVEDRIARMFGTAGQIGAEMVPDIRPVVLAGNLDQPGTSTFRGRRFKWSVLRTAVVYAARNSWQMKVNVPVIVEGVSVHGYAIAANNALEFRVLNEVDAALASVYGANFAYWTERAEAGNSNVAPVATDPAAGVAVVAVGSSFHYHLLPGAAAQFDGAQAYTPLDIFLAANQGIGFTTWAAGTISLVVTFHCRIF